MEQDNTDELREVISRLDRRLRDYENGAAYKRSPGRSNGVCGWVSLGLTVVVMIGGWLTVWGKMTEQLRATAARVDRLEMKLEQVAQDTAYMRGRMQGGKSTGNAGNGNNAE